MNTTMKRTLHIVGLVLVLLLAFCWAAQDADAASYKSSSVYDTTETTAEEYKTA